MKVNRSLAEKEDVVNATLIRSRNAGYPLLRLVCSGLVAAGITMLVPTNVYAVQKGNGLHESSPQSADDAPTFSADVAPILQQNCQACHQDGGMGPMPLVTYDEVRRWAPLVKDRVTKRIMPPWHLDRTIGIQEYRNDASLTDTEIATIAEWVDAGTPEGDPADLPPPVKRPKMDEWWLAERFGRPPDLVVESPPETVPAEGGDMWWNQDVPLPELNETRYLMGAELMPSPNGHQSLHHGNIHFRQQGYSTGIVEAGVGTRWAMPPSDIGVALRPGPSWLHMRRHYRPIGYELKDDVIRVGIWLHPEDFEPNIVGSGDTMFRIDLPGTRGRGLIIPPRGQLSLERVFVLNEPTLINAIRPHMHLRGKTMTMTAIYPAPQGQDEEGVVAPDMEVLFRVDNFNGNWMLDYIFAEHARPLLPKGTILMLHSQHDNTANNRTNPDPDQWVTFGGRSNDEMSHAWINIAHLTDEQYERMVAARRGRVTAQAP